MHDQFFLEIVAFVDALIEGDEGIEACPLISCGIGVTAASATFGWLTRALSTLGGADAVAETLTTSSMRPTAIVAVLIDAAAVPVKYWSRTS